MLSLIHTMRVRLRQLATLRLWDVASKAENWYRTHSLCLRQIANKMQKTHSVNGPLMQRISIEPILCICVKLLW